MADRPSKASHSASALHIHRYPPSKGGGSGANTDDDEYPVPITKAEKNNNINTQYEKGMKLEVTNNNTQGGRRKLSVQVEDDSGHTLLPNPPSPTPPPSGPSLSLASLQTSLFSSLPSRSLFSGYLKKKSPTFGWDKRYFVLDSFIFSYFKEKNNKFPLRFFSLLEIQNIIYLKEKKGGKRFNIKFKDISNYNNQGNKKKTFTYEDSTSGSSKNSHKLGVSGVDKELSTSHGPPHIHDNDDDNDHERSVSSYSHESSTKAGGHHHHNNNTNNTTDRNGGISNNGTVIIAPDSMKNSNGGSGKVLRLLADTVEEAEGWIKALTMAINEANKRENIFINAAINKLNQCDSTMNGLSTSSPFISLSAFPQQSNGSSHGLSPRTPLALKAWGAGTGGGGGGVFDFNMGVPTELQKSFFALKYSTTGTNNNNNTNNNKTPHSVSQGSSPHPTHHNNLRPPPPGGIGVLIGGLRKPLIGGRPHPPSTPPPLPPPPSSGLGGLGVGVTGGPPLAYILGSVQTNSDILYFLLHVLLDASELSFKTSNNLLLDSSGGSPSSGPLPPPPSAALRNRSPSPGLPPRSIGNNQQEPFSYSNNNPPPVPAATATAVAARSAVAAAAAAVAAAQSSALSDENSSFYQLMRVLGEQESRKRHQRTASVLDERWIAANNHNNSKDKDGKAKNNKDAAARGGGGNNKSRSNNNNQHNNNNANANKKQQGLVSQAKATRFLTDTIIEEYDVDEMPPPPTANPSQPNSNANYLSPPENQGPERVIGSNGGKKSSHRKSLSEVSPGDIERARALLSTGLGGGGNVRNKGSRKQRKTSGNNNKNNNNTLKRSASNASASSSMTIAQRLEEMNKKMDNFKSLVKRLSPEEKKSITHWLCQSNTRESIASIFCTNDVLSHDAALRVLWLSFLLQRMKDEIKQYAEEGNKGGKNGGIMIDHSSVESAASGLFALFLRSTVLPIIPSSSLVLKCLHSLLTMMVTDISSFTRFTIDNGFFQPIRNPTLFFPLFSSLSYSSDFFIRKRLLKDLLSLFHLRPLNHTALLLQKGWQKWLFLLLADIPRLSLHPAGSNQVSPLFKKIITQIMFLFTLLHFHSFLSHNNEGGSTTDIIIMGTGGGAGGGGKNNNNNNKDSTPSFDAVIAPSLLLSLLASPPDDLSLPRSILLSLIIKLSYNTVLFHSSLHPNDPRSNRRTSLYDLSPSHSRSTSQSASVSTSHGGVGGVNKSNKASYTTLGLAAGGVGGGGRLIGVEEADDGELSYDSDHSVTNMNTISSTKSSFVQSTMKNPFDRSSLSVLSAAEPSYSSTIPPSSHSSATAAKYYVPPPPPVMNRGMGMGIGGGMNNDNNNNKKAELDFVMWCHLLHLLTLIKCFVFNPARLYEILNNNVSLAPVANNNNSNNNNNNNNDDAPDPSLPPERPAISMPATNAKNAQSYYSVSPSVSQSSEHSSKNHFFDPSAALFSPGVTGGHHSSHHQQNKSSSSRQHSSGFSSSAGDAYVVAFNRIADLPLPQPYPRASLVPNHSAFKSMDSASAPSPTPNIDNNGAASSTIPPPPFGPFTKSLINQLETSFYGTFSPSSSSTFRLHLSETNGLAADIELLSHTLHLLETLAAESWSFDQAFPNGINGSGESSASLISQRLAAEISFFQDSIAFLSIVSPMHSKSSSLFLTGSTASSAFLSVSDISDVIYSFLRAKTSLSRQKIFKEYEIKYKEKQKQLEKQAKARSKLLDMQMVADAQKESKISKVLLLGAGESGKSTLFKQIQRKYGEGFNITERKKYLFIIFNNIVRCMKSLIYHSDRLLTRVPFSSLSNNAGASTTSISMEGEESKLFISYLNIDDYFDYQLSAQGKPIPQWLSYAKDGQTPAYSIMKDILLHVHKLWTEEKGVQVTFENRALFDRFQLFDSDGFFLSKLADIIEPPITNEGGGSGGGGIYIPTEEDIIRVRQRTTGIVEYNFQLDHQWFRLLDVAGQRSERRKWIQHFGEVTGVIFVAAISEYDQVLCEDAKTNRLLESITLWAEIVNCHWFKQTPVVLFLNKRDLFAEKIKKVPLNVCFPKYRGEQDYQEGIKFIKKEFLKKRKDKNKIVYVHVVCAVDPDNIQKAMNSVKDTLIQSSLGLAGLA